jgi:hypothetical protein
MSWEQNTLSVGSVGGSVVVGKNNHVTTSSTPEGRTSSAERPGAMRPRLGFVVDIISYATRDAETKLELQSRLDTLLDTVVAGLHIDHVDVKESNAGDSRVVFLPVGADTSRMAPAIVDGMIECLRRDNLRYRERVRLRMTMGAGLVGDGPLGFTGELVIDLHRLLDSSALRTAMADDENCDLGILVGQAFYDEVIRPGYLDPSQFVRVEVKVKEFAAPAWLRLCVSH